MKHPRAAPGPEGPTFFFMHIMKTAGTSFALQLLANFAVNEIFPSRDSPRRQDQYWKVEQVRAAVAEGHEQVRIFHGHFPFMVADVVGADTTLTILRDPVERTISHLRHCERHFPEHQGKSLEAIYDDDWHRPLLFRNYQVKQFALTAEDRPKAHNQVIEVDAAREAIARANLDRVAVLGLTERYPEFLDEVARRFGWTLTRDLHLQASPGKAEVPEGLRERIRAENAADVAFYEHACSLYDRRRTVAQSDRRGPASATG